MIDDSPPSFGKRLMHAWNAFTRRENDPYRLDYSDDIGRSYYRRPDYVRYSLPGNEQSITASIYTRISIDVAALDFKHVKLDDDDRYLRDMDTYLNDCLTLQANIDQASRSFFQDAVMTMLESGHIAIVPIDTSMNPNQTGGYDIFSMRVGQVVTWYPRHVQVSVYNDRRGEREEIIVRKENVAIIENPFYSVMNEPNSTLQRLKRKLAMLDAVDEQSASGKLDLIIQLPYVIRSDARREQAKNRRKDIEDQLRGSQYGIAYTDGTERITQLNRPAENNLWKQVVELTDMLYGQLGLTPAIFNGTAEEAEMLNYFNRTIEPIASALTQAMLRSFLTKTARTQNQSIMFYRDPFKLVPVEKVAEIVDKFTRNEIATSNEIRTKVIGWKPSTDPKADELRNANLSAPKEETVKINNKIEEGDLQNGS